MTTEPAVLYKLMILYLLRQANLPMRNDQLSEFFLSKEYAGYMQLQQAISELLDAHLIKCTETHDASRYEITREGEETLNFFGSNLSEVIREDIHGYLKENRIRLRNEMGITSDYHKTNGSDYEVVCEVREGRSSLMKLSISVPSEEEAQLICNRWQTVSQEIYSSVMMNLLKSE